MRNWGGCWSLHHSHVVPYTCHNLSAGGAKRGREANDRSANQSAFAGVSQAVYDEFAAEVASGRELIDQALMLARQ